MPKWDFKWASVRGQRRALTPAHSHIYIHLQPSPCRIATRNDPFLPLEIHAVEYAYNRRPHLELFRVRSTSDKRLLLCKRHFNALTNYIVVKLVTEHSMDQHYWLKAQELHIILLFFTNIIILLLLDLNLSVFGFFIWHIL